MSQLQTVKEPPVIKGHFLNGNIEQLTKNQLNFLTQTHQSHGDYIKYKLLPNMYMYGLFHPDAVQHVLQSSNYRKPDFFYNSVRPLTGYGLFTSEGDAWLKQRRLAQPAFLKKKVEALTETVIKAIKEEINTWDEYQDNDVIDITRKMTKITLKTLSTALFSIDISNDANEMSLALRDALGYISKRMSNPMSLPIWIPTQANKDFAEDRKAIIAVVDKIIDSRRNSTESYNDLLDTLIKSKDDESGDMLDNTQLRDEMITMLIAGHDTTSAALSWTFYLLAKNKDKENILINEIDSVLGDREIELKDLEKLEYNRMVFEEAMRLYPPAWSLPREAIEDDVINGYQIKKKSTIMIAQYITHRHTDFWEKPLEFYPEHFEKSKVEKRHKFAYFPFGGGARMCIGKAFALLEAQLILACIMQKFSFALVDNKEVELDTTFTLIPKDGINLHIKKRK